MLNPGIAPAKLAPPSVNEWESRWASRGFALLCAAHLAIWFAAPSLLYHSLPRDTLESIAWGQMWQLGYDKHPLLAPWLAAGVTQLFGVTGWPIYLLDQAAVLLCFWAIWRMAREMVGPSRAVIAVALLDAVHYYNVSSFTFNPNVAMLPTWALTALAFHQALRHPTYGRWALVGLAAGLAMLAKYESGVLYVCMLAVLLTTEEGRRALVGRGPLIALAVGLLVWSPNLYWLIRHDFAPVHYALGNMSLAEGEAPAALLRGSSLYPPLLFLLEQLGALAPMAFLYAPFAGPQGHDRAHASPFDHRFVLWMAAGPLLVTLLIAVISDATLIARWGFPFFSLAGLALVLHYPPVLTKRRLAAFSMLYGTLSLVLAGGLTWVVDFRPDISGERPYSIRFPGPELGKAVTDAWHATNSGPLPYVIGDRWTVATATVYSPDHPKPLFDDEASSSPWVDASSVERRGAVLVVRLHATETPALVNALRQHYPDLANEKMVTLMEQVKGVKLDDHFWVAVLPPLADRIQAQAPGQRPNAG